MSRYNRAEMAWVLITVLAASLRAASYPAPEAPRDAAQLGARIQRTMRLLATSTPEQCNRVKVLFYGQSITVQDPLRAIRVYRPPLR